MSTDGSTLGTSSTGQRPSRPHKKIATPPHRWVAPKGANSPIVSRVLAARSVRPLLPTLLTLTVKNTRIGGHLRGVRAMSRHADSERGGHFHAISRGGEHSHAFCRVVFRCIGVCLHGLSLSGVGSGHTDENMLPRPRADERTHSTDGGDIALCALILFLKERPLRLRKCCCCFLIHILKHAH